MDWTTFLPSLRGGIRSCTHGFFVRRVRNGAASLAGHDFRILRIADDLFGLRDRPPPTQQEPLRRLVGRRSFFVVDEGIVYSRLWLDSALVGRHFPLGTLLAARQYSGCYRRCVAGRGPLRVDSLSPRCWNCFGIRRTFHPVWGGSLGSAILLRPVVSIPLFAL